MRLIAVHAIHRKAGVIAPGSPFVSPEEEAQSLLRLGAAIPDPAPPPEPAPEPEQKPAGKARR